MAGPRRRRAPAATRPEGEGSGAVHARGHHAV